MIVSHAVAKYPASLPYADAHVRLTKHRSWSIITGETGLTHSRSETSQPLSIASTITILYHAGALGNILYGGR